MIHSKFVAVWQRAKVKIKSRLLLKYMLQDRVLFGTNILSEEERDEHALITEVMRTKVEAAQKLDIPDKPKRWLWYPENRWKWFWGFLYFCAVLETALVMPVRLAFYDTDNESPWCYLSLTVDVLFFIDMLITLNTAFYNPRGVLVTDRLGIFLRYLKSWFLFDLASCFPLYIFEASSTGSPEDNFGGFIHLVGLPRLYNLIKLSRVVKLLQKIQNQDCLERLQGKFYVKNSVLKIIIFILTITILVHLMACFWFLAAKSENLGPQTWTTLSGLQDRSVEDIYVGSLYWTITTLTTVGYGDIVPGTGMERVIAGCWMVFSMIFMSLVIGSVSALYSGMHSKDSLLTMRLAAIDEFAFEARLEKTLSCRLRQAIKYSAEHQGYGVRLKHCIFSELPRELKYEVAMAMHRGAAKSIPFFTEKDRAFIVSIVPFLNHMFVNMLSTVYKEKDYADEIYFIVKGGCCIMVTEKNAIRKMQRGAYFGEIEVISQIPRKYTVTAHIDTELLTMDKHLLDKVRKDFSAIYQDMEKVAKIREKLNAKAQRQFFQLLRAANRSSRERCLTQAMEHWQPVDSQSEPPHVILRRGSALLQIPTTNKPFDVAEGFHTLETRISTLERTTEDIQTQLQTLLQTLQLQQKESFVHVSGSEDTL